MRNYAQDRADFERLAATWGISFYDGVPKFTDPAWRDRFDLACDAQPELVTQVSGSIPAMLVTFIDPDILRVIYAPNKAVEIFGEVRKGTFEDVTAMFPVIEQTVEVSAYGDFNNNGRAGANTNFPNRENFLYQTVGEYGELEMARAGLAKIAWATEVKKASITGLNKFQNLSYFLGIEGLQNYGLLNDPSLPTAIAPAPKGNGNLTWYSGSVPNATAQEVYNDIQSLVTQLFTQSSGNIDAETKMVLALSPKSSGALNFTNTYNVNVYDQLKKNYPNMRIETAVQYGELTAQNPQGSAAGEIVQVIADEVEGQDTGYCAFSEKLRGGPVIRDLSSFRQKMSQGTWGAIVRQPFAIATMIGV